ncbi:transposase [Williamsia sp.]|uniref:transposase n=1 Tax=Williamsia sp. TaxID=1872085 RepID=UPI002F91F9C0
MGGSVDWSHGWEHMLERHEITVRMATEALTDPGAVILSPDPASTSGASDRTIGYSNIARSILVVITVTEEGATHGINGWRANSTSQRIYREGRL